MWIFWGLLIAVIFGIIFLSIQLKRKKIKILSISFLLTIILAIITPGLLFTYFSFALFCINGCFVNKYTPKWFFTMSPSFIGSLPIIQPINEVQYYYNTNLNESWQVTYKSNSQLSELQKEIDSYFTNKGIKSNSQVSCYNGYWDINDETVTLRYESNDNCIMIYLDDKKSYILVRALEMK